MPNTEAAKDIPHEAEARLQRHLMDAVRDGLARDIGALLTMEAAQRQALAVSDRDRALLETIFETAQDATVVFNRHDQLLISNARFRAIFPHPEAMETQGRPITMQALDGTVLLPEQWPHRRALRGEAFPNPQIVRMKIGDQPQRVFRLQCTPFHDSQGALCNVLMAMHDVTQAIRQRRHIETTRAIAHACAHATEEVIVANEALRVLLSGTGAALGSVVVRDVTRPGFARALTFQHERQVPSIIEAEWRTEVNRLPVVADSPITSLRVMATDQAFFGPFEIPSTEASARLHVHALTVPLRWDGAVIGALSVHYWPEDAETIDQELILLAADEVGMALHRAWLYEEAQRMALVDPLTGLSNHRALQDVVRRELAAGATQNLPVSIIMLDLDHFRQFNETYGHDSGDHALRSVAKAIRNVLRHGDMAARFSGKTFAVVLPTTDADMADALAVQMQEAIAAQTLFKDAQGAPVCLTISAGHATFPLHASAPASLLKAADLALYAAKRGGRNSVVAYTQNLIEDSAHLLPVNIGDSIAKMGEISLPTGADLETVQAFITAIDLRDGYTAAHSDGVSRYAVAIATEMHLPTEYVEALRLGGLVHDVGKIGVSDQVLRKPGKLDPEEWRQMQQHTVMGEAILRPLEQLRQLLPLVRWHHERLDGSGYPDKLRGDEIPLLVRILSVADVFEAFTAERPYHPGRPAIEGLRLLQREAAEGKMDPYVVEVFEGILICQGLVTDGVRGEQDLVLAA